MFAVLGTMLREKAQVTTVRQQGIHRVLALDRQVIQKGFDGRIEAHEVSIDRKREALQN